MSWKTLVALVVLAVGLAGFFYYDSHWLSPARDKVESAKGRLWTVEAKDVEGLTIKRKGETVRLKRAEGGGWEMLDPVKARGERAAADDVVTSLVMARMDREIDPNPAKLAEFGLDPAEAEVTLEVKGRKEPLVLLVGTKSPTGAWVYAKEGGKAPVMTVSEGIGRDAGRPASDFRDKTVMALDRKSVTGLDLDVSGDRIALVADPPGKWQIVKPTTYRADGDLISDFLDKLEGTKAREFVADSPASLAPYGLDRPATATVWTGKDKERSSKALLVGKVDPDKKGVYVMRAGENSVMLAPEDLWTAFPKTVAALRDKVVVSYAYDKAKQIELRSSRGRVAIERDGTGWKITAPEALKADSAAVNGLLWAIRDLRASGFLADSAADVSRLLKKPEVSVKIWEDGTAAPKTLLVQPSAEVRGGRPAALAAVEGQGPVMLVDAKALTDLAKTETDLRDKSVFPPFELADVKRARIAGTDKPLVVERSGDNDWKIVEPSRGSARAEKVTNLLLSLKSLRWKDIASAKGDDAARYGLDRPELEVSLAKADGGELAALAVGKQDGAVTYVRLKSGPAIYAVDTQLLSDLKKARAEISG